MSESTYRSRSREQGLRYEYRATENLVLQPDRLLLDRCRSRSRDRDNGEVRTLGSLVNYNMGDRSIGCSNAHSTPREQEQSPTAPQPLEESLNLDWLL